MKILKLSALIVAISFLSGCAALFSAGTYLTVGPGANKAEYRPDSKAPMLVLVENYSGIGDLNQDAMFLNAALVQEVKENKIAPLVDQAALNKLRESKGEEKFRQMGISDIASTIGAKQVLYVNVLQSELNMPSGKSTVSGFMEARVRIIDARSAATRWPDSEDGEDVKFTAPVTKRDSAEADLQLRHDLTDQMAVKICNLFHDWTPQFENQEKTQASGISDGPG